MLGEPEFVAEIPAAIFSWPTRWGEDFFGLNKPLVALGHIDFNDGEEFEGDWFIVGPFEWELEHGYGKVWSQTSEC